MMDIFIILTFFLNAFLFLLYGIDKWKAVHKKRRIREIVLVLPSFFFMSIGAMLGMIVFNHKTSKPKFRFLIPFSFILNIIFFIALKKLP